MAKIYNISTKQLLADIPKYPFDEVPTVILESTGKLTIDELNIMEKAIEQSRSIIGMCYVGHEDDIILWHSNYIDKLIRRLERALEKGA